MESKLRVGTKVKGFAFNKDYIQYDISYPAEMVAYEGKIGTVVEYIKRVDSYRIKFEDGTSWSYPAGLVKKFVVSNPVVEFTDPLLILAKQLIEIKTGCKVLDIELENGSGTKFIYKSEKRPGYWRFIDLKIS